MTRHQQPAPKQLPDRCIVRSALKRRILRLAKTHRAAANFNRVADSTLDECEFALDRFIVGKLCGHPSVGRTIKF